MGLIAAGRQVVGQRQLHRGAGGQGAHQLQFLNTERHLAGGHPTDAKTAHQRFGEGAAVQSSVVRIEGLGRQGLLLAEIEFTVDIVFNQKAVVFLQEFQQTTLLVIAHTAAQGILKVGH